MFTSYRYVLFLVYRYPLGAETNANGLFIAKGFSESLLLSLNLVGPKFFIPKPDSHLTSERCFLQFC